MLSTRDLTILNTTAIAAASEYLAIDEDSLAILREEGLTEAEIRAFLRVDPTPEYTREVAALKLLLGEDMAIPVHTQAA